MKRATEPRQQARPKANSRVKLRATPQPALQARMRPPVFILAPPRCFTSVVCAMLGQHPQIYAFPETILFTVETVAELWGGNLQGPLRLRHGLKRAVAQLYFGEQTDASVVEARGWLRRRASLTTGSLFELLAEKVFPCVPLEKSPPVVFRTASMRRMLSMFPSARFIHLTRHPRGHGESNMRFARARAEAGTLPPHWIYCPADYPQSAARKAKAQREEGAEAAAENAKVLDPQFGWIVHNMNICNFLESVPDAQKLRVRGEDLLNDPQQHLRNIVEWLGLRTDDEAVESMNHPERWPYAFVGPRGARLGFGKTFLENPTLRRDHPAHSLDGPLAWRTDGEGFSAEVKDLAKEFGYR